MKAIAAMCIITALGCGQKPQGLPYGATVEDDGGEDADADGSTEDGLDIECVDVWGIEDDGVVIQPETCLAWSPISQEQMDWYVAASAEEGELGGCGDNCPEGSGHCATLELGGRDDWRLPSFEELKEAAKSDPNIPDVEGKLWTRDTGQGASSNAWVVDLSKAGVWVELGKDDDGIWVRCVSDS